MFRSWQTSRCVHLVGCVVISYCVSVSVFPKIKATFFKIEYDCDLFSLNGAECVGQNSRNSTST